MTELELYKFIRNNELEVSWFGDDRLNLWMHPRHIEEFSSLIGDRCDADTGGIDFKLQNTGDVVFDLVELCEDFEIDPKNIVEPEDNGVRV